MKKQENEEKRKKYLQEHIDILRKQEEEIEKRIKEKRQVQDKIKETIKGIPAINDEAVMNMAKTCRKDHYSHECR